MKKLESIVHPIVGGVQRAFLAKAEAEGHDIIVLDIPLLFEKTGQHGLDAVVVVSAPADQQRERVLARPGMTVEKFEQILKLQVPDAEKRARADVVIPTGNGKIATWRAARRLVSCLADPKRRYRGQ